MGVNNVNNVNSFGAFSIVNSKEGNVFAGR